MKKYLLTVLSLMLTLPCLAYEDCIITTDGKLSNIKIQYNDIIDVFPMITIMNDKNTLIVHPLKEGFSEFSVIKNNKEKFYFGVNVTEEKTSIPHVEGFDILTVDCPPNSYEYSFDLDLPPEKNISGTKVNTHISKPASGSVTGAEYNEYIENLEEPPELRGAD